METDLWSAAKKYQESHKWEKAIAYYERYRRENKHSDDTFYVSFAKCLRLAGRTYQAKKLLTEVETLYPNSEGIFQELYALYKISGEWHNAKSVAETLVELNPQQENYYFQLGRASAFLKDYTNAKQVYMAGLKHKHNMSYKHLIEKVKRGFTTGPADFSSEYVYINGKNNLGAIIHHAGDKKYFTKITKYDQNAKREETFYHDIRSRFPQLKEVVPAYIDSQVIDDILYLTIEWIEGSNITSEKANDIIDMSQKVSSVKYQDIIHKYSNPAYLFRFRNKPTFIIQFFTQIHKKYYNKKLFSELYKLIRQNNYPTFINQVIHRLESQIMDNYLYIFIDPQKHYSLLHGDFHLANMKVKKQNETMKVFDWASFTTGPNFVDIARYLSKSLFSYKEVKEIYLNNDQTGGKLTLIEKIFFLYALILLYLLRLKAKDVEKHMSTCILPALEDMEYFVVQFKEEEYASSLLTIRDEKDDSENKVKLLEAKLGSTNKQNKALKKQIQNLEKKNKDIITSKSWRITAPLRKLMGRRKR